MVSLTEQSASGSFAPGASSGVTTLQVPEALRLYLGRRCDDPDALLVDLLRGTTPGRSLLVTSAEDPYRGLRACSLEAVTVLSRSPRAVEATIVSRGKRAVHAGTTSTDLILSSLPETLRSAAGRGLLRDRIEVSFPTEDLPIGALVDQGAGVLIRWQAATFDISFAVSGSNQGLSDIRGHVSGSGRRF